MCHEKYSMAKKGLPVKSIVRAEISLRCLVDLIDMHTNPDNNIQMSISVRHTISEFYQYRLFILRFT